MWFSARNLISGQKILNKFLKGKELYLATQKEGINGILKNKHYLIKLYSIEWILSRYTNIRQRMLEQEESI